MEDDLSWTPLLISKRSDQESDGLSEIKDLLEKGSLFILFSSIYMICMSDDSSFRFVALSEEPLLSLFSGAF